MNELTLLVDYLKSSIEKCNDYKHILQIYNAYCAENNRKNYIYDADNKNDLIGLIELGANVESFYKLYKSGNKHVILNENGTLLSLSSISILKYILKESENMARFILAYPYLEVCKPIYVEYITKKIIE